MALLRPYFSKSHGVPRVDDRRVLSGIIVINRNGSRWSDAPKEYGPFNIVYNRLKRWSDMEVFARIMTRLAAEAPNHKTISIDATYLKAHRTASRLRLKRGAWTSCRANKRRHKHEAACRL
jgi:transposase